MTQKSTHMGQSDGLHHTFKILTHFSGILLAKVLKQDFTHDVLLHLQVLYFVGQCLKQDTDYNIHGDSKILKSLARKCPLNESFLPNHHLVRILFLLSASFRYFCIFVGLEKQKVLSMNVTWISFLYSMFSFFISLNALDCSKIKLDIS